MLLMVQGTPSPLPSIAVMNNLCLYAGLGNWSDSDCTLTRLDRDTGEVQCNCSHLTNFAILVNVVSITTITV